MIWKRRGSHRLDEDPRLIAEFAGQGRPIEATVSQRQMPGKWEFLAKAGDAMVMDLRTFHTAMPNTGTRHRRTLILMYAPFWRKSGLQRSARQLVKAGVELSPLQRQLLALDQRNGAGNIYDEEWLATNPRPDIR